MTRYEAELREQPRVLERLLQDGRVAAERTAAAMRRRGVRIAVLAARGSSDNAARYGQYLLGIRNGLLATLATPSLFTQYDAPPALGGALVVGVSQSGESPDVVEVVREGRRQGALTLAITNAAGSPLAASAELVLPLGAGEERAVAATKTYTAELMAFALLSAALDGGPDAWDALAGVPGSVARAIDLAGPVAEGAAGYREAPGLLVVGRGYNLATVLETTLKIKETCALLADGYSSADFLHGPSAVLDTGVPVLVVAPGPRQFEDLEAVARLAGERGAPLLVVSDRTDLLSRADLGLPVPAGIPEWLTPLVAIAPGQLFALHLSVARGRNPDAPRGLAKVTRTR